MVIQPYVIGLHFKNIANNLLFFGFNELWIKITLDNANIENLITINATCFKEGTKILGLNDHHIEEYIPVEQLRKGTLVKTFSQGYKPVHNPNEQTKTVDRL
jgi:hypothetical protein